MHHVGKKRLGSELSGLRQEIALLSHSREDRNVFAKIRIQYGACTAIGIKRGEGYKE